MNRLKYALCLLPMLAILFSHASAQAGDVASAPSAVAADSNELHPGDIARVTVWRRPDMSGDFPVDADGTLKHPLFQHVVVGGVPLSEARQHMRDYLSTFDQDPQFVLEPLLRVAVSGEVRAPNLYSLPRETTISQAIALAGGPTERGRLDRVRLIRGDKQITIDLLSPTDRIGREVVHSGDRIVIGRKRDWLRDYAAPVASLLTVAVSLATLLRQ